VLYCFTCRLFRGLIQRVFCEQFVTQSVSDPGDIVLMIDVQVCGFDSLGWELLSSSYC